MSSDQNVDPAAQEEFKEPPQPKDLEKQQEAMLKSKYPGLANKPGGGSALLHKRLQKGGQRFFDSGDYNMTKSKIGHKPQLTQSEKVLLTESTGNAIPTAEGIHRKTAHRTSSLAEHEVDHVQ